MKLKRILLSLLLALSLVLSLPPSAAAADSTNTIIRKMLNYYRHYQEGAKTDILRLLDQMADTDPDLADNWQKVMEGWDHAVNHLEIPEGVLPDGLPEDDSLCIVVMGYALNRNGTMRAELVGRCQVALASAQKYPNAYILCTGGGTASGNRKATEAGRMAQWLMENGIAESRIIIENKSLSTETNALYSFQILTESYPQVKSLALISSDYHVRRCHVMFHTVMSLNDWDEQYMIVSDAGYDTGATGNEGVFEEAETIAELMGLAVNNMSKPTLSKLEGIMVQGDSVYMVGEELNLTVTAYYNTDVVRDVTADADFTGCDLTQSGRQEVTIAYTENGRTQSTTMQITVVAPPTESTAPETTAPPETAPPVAEAAEEPVEARPPVGLVLLPLALAVVLSLLVSRMLRKKRRRRRRKPMNLE